MQRNCYPSSPIIFSRRHIHLLLWYLPVIGIRASAVFPDAHALFKNATLWLLCVVDRMAVYSLIAITRTAAATATTKRICKDILTGGAWCAP
jgi:hypothetical protein